MKYNLSFSFEFFPFLPIILLRSFAFCLFAIASCSRFFFSSSSFAAFTFVTVLGCDLILSSIGIYGKIVEFGGAGATVPISGFGYCLGTGVIEEINSVGFLGIFTGGVKACAAGICAAVVFGFLCALCSKPSIK